MEQMNYNLLFRWFVGLEMDDAVWDVTVFTKNRERLIDGAVSQQLLESVLVEARAHDLLSEEHFTVDGTLIQAWAAARSFKEKSRSARAGCRFGHKGEVLVARQGGVDDRPGGAFVQEGHGGQGGAELSGPRADRKPQRSGGGRRSQRGGQCAEREAALRMLDRTVTPKTERAAELEITLGADTLYQEEKFIAALRDREVAPHVSEYTQQSSNLGKNSLSEAERADPRRSISQRKRKLIERVFGWSKLDRGLRQVKLRGLDRVDWFYRLTIVAHNLVRMRRLIPIEALAG